MPRSRVESCFRPCLTAGFFLALALSPAAALADAEVKTIEAAPIPKRNGEDLRTYVNFRAGVSAQARGSGQANMCLEAAPLSLLSLEACGSGAGFLNNDTTPELAHFRSLWRVTSFKKGDYVFSPRVGAGFAELQTGKDAPGFQFTGTDRDRGSTSGPEALVSMQMRKPVGAGFEFIGDLQAGSAYLAYAPQLQLPSTEVQPFAALTFGMGW